VRWTPVVRGIAEVDGVPREVLRAFSRRRVEIERSMVLRGTCGARAAEAAALATRRAKRHEPERELFDGWRARAQEFDWSVGRLELTASVEQTPVELDAIVDALVGADGLTAHASTFTRQDVIRGVGGILAAAAPVTALQLEALADAVLTDERIVALKTEPGRELFRGRDGEVTAADPAAQRYSTTEIVELERRIVDAERDGRDVGRWAVPTAMVAGAMAGEPRLSEEQRAMVEVLCGGGDAIALVAGRAGTGKTFALATAREAWERSGHQVFGVAVARRAARELEQGAGIPSTSVAAMLRRFEHGGRLPRGSVLVLDEASMIGTRDLATLVEHACRSESKLVLVGDPAQLPAVAAGGMFRALVEPGRAVQLVENRRQVEGWERTAVQQLREGETAAALAMYDAHRRIHVEPDQDEARSRLVSDWWSASDVDSVMIASRRTDVADLNVRAREYMRAAGHLGPDGMAVSEQTFAVGDAVVLRRNDSRVGAINGERGVVVGIDRDRIEMTVETGTARLVLNAGYVFASREPSIVHGYAMTCHVAQGATVDRAYVLADGGMCREWGYTALTRGREQNHLYVPADRIVERDEYGPRGQTIGADPIAQLTFALARSESEPLALDHWMKSRQRGRGVER
jgi:ATP-dependent exoDNAse (exonuclease V) alpha subunit